MYNYQLTFVLSYLVLLTNLVGAEKKYDEFDSDIGRLEFVRIKKGSPSLSEVFQDSFRVPEKSTPVQATNIHKSRNFSPPDIKPPAVTYDSNLNTSAGKLSADADELPSLSDSSQGSVPAINLNPREPVPAVGISPNSSEETRSPLNSIVVDKFPAKIVHKKDDGEVIKTLSPLKPDLTNSAEKSDISLEAKSATVASEADVLPFLTSDFFADSLAGATTEKDPMGTQRLLQVKNSRFSPSVVAGSSFKHTSNPDKAETPVRKNSTTLDLSLGINLGLGEYGVGDYFVCTPAASLMQMRTYNDPLGKFDKDMRVYDADVFIAGLSVPLVISDVNTLTFSHSYVAPSSFRGDKNNISYSNTPSVTLTKNLPMNNGQMLILVAGMSYTFSDGDTLEEQIADPFYFNFLKAVMEAGGGSPSNDYPGNLQDGYSYMLSSSYMIPLSEKISIVPSLSYQSFFFTEGMNSGRIDKTLNIGASASYVWLDWLSISLMGNYTSKWSNNPDTPEFEDFIFGVGVNANYAF